jgi:signal transduction histidine kinase
MPVSRLRIRLAVWYGTALLIGLTLLDSALYLYLRRRSNTRFTADLTRAAGELATAIDLEAGESARDRLAELASEVLGEWTRGDLTYLVLDGWGRELARGGLPPAANPPAWTTGAAGRLRAGTVTEDRAAGVRYVLAASPGADDYLVAAGGSLQPLAREGRMLATWLLASLPVMLLFSLGAGYLFSRRALMPLHAITRAIDGIEPGALDRRLPVGSPADELDELSARFNGLLGRLQAAQESNRRFLAEVAHQIRTPLTIVRGESSLGLGRLREGEEYRLALRRIGQAAEQMSYRVKDLLLLAEAQVTGPPPVDAEVELDGLALECTELMNGRAREEGRGLRLGRVEPVTALGNPQLLQEVLLELLDNALRHGRPETEITVSAYREENRACLEVSSGGEPIEGAGEVDEPAGERLGLSIVHWIAHLHSGRLDYRHRDGENIFTLCWPVTSRVRS